jgi:hypothetical protein
MLRSLPLSLDSLVADTNHAAPTWMHPCDNHNAVYIPLKFQWKISHCLYFILIIIVQLHRTIVHLHTNLIVYIESVMFSATLNERPIEKITVERYEHTGFRFANMWEKLS